MDFTIKTYKKLLSSLTARGYTFQTFAEFLENPAPKCIILRHDVEARYGNALAFAEIQKELGVRGTYYFRFLPNHFDKEIIRKISLLGHEIGYHYDDLSHCHGNYEAALKRFEKNLATLREIAPVKTICMEGAPLSKWDNREMWRQGDREKGRSGDVVGGRQSAVGGQHSEVEHWNPGTLEQSTRNPYPVTRNPKHYRDYGILGEPYFDIDFTQVLYLTDTGRRWDGEKVSVRDRTNSKFQAPNSKQIQNSKFKIQNFKFHSTQDIINAASLLPDQIMFTFHPQRWTDDPIPWVKELVMQNVKNVVKRLVLMARGIGRRAKS